jgi:hypothetical protein
MVQAYIFSILATVYIAAATRVPKLKAAIVPSNVQSNVQTKPDTENLKAQH